MKISALLTAFIIAGNMTFTAYAENWTAAAGNTEIADNAGSEDSALQAVTAPRSISALSAVVIEADSGRVLWGKQENVRRPMASTTKIMTTLLTLESGDLDSEFTVDSSAIAVEGSSMGLMEGDIVTKRDLCIGMLLPSGNDAAGCAAVKVGGSTDKFIEMMNSRAAQMGLYSTHFVTPSGLHDNDHYSTAYDMAMLAGEAMKNPDFAAICRETSITLDYGNPPYRRTLANTNKLLSMYEGCIGVKTGFTDEAGRCLVSCAERGGVRLICVTLNAPDDWNDHRLLLDYGFSVTSRETFSGDTSYFPDVAGGTADSVELIPACPPEYTSVSGSNREITRKISAPPLLTAPVTAGECYGTLTLWDGDTLLATIPMTAAADVPASGQSRYRESLCRRLINLIKDIFFADR